VTDAQVQSYQRDGYLAVRGVLDATQIGTLRRVTEALVERSRAVTKSDALFDLDPRHTGAQPVLRRIKNPADNAPLYRWVTFESPIPDIVAQLLGPAVRFHHSKLNMKGSLIGAAVEFHQDAAFYPHSNDDVLAVGLLLDDATADNGAMAVLPGSHRGPIYTHYDGQGRFVGCMRPDDVDWICPHQNVKTVSEAWIQRIGVPGARVIETRKEYGNVGPANVLLNLNRGFESGKLRHGDTILMFGQGSGMSVGAMLLRWHDPTTSRARPTPAQGTVT